ncbi:MAG: 5'-methylthioadenosine/S-adenosylhomocysteine nucleosidase [Oceanospirillaceae bacterium]|nr:5'-methylthioadenosine/S-adenosylhomocysteine nucleosidase [Oceanospirillaceae bacterium]
MASILFICALAEEKQSLTEILSIMIKRHSINSTLNLEVEQYREGSLDIYVSQSGMGNVNAGVKLAFILERISIDQIILIGVGGALQSRLKIGDMVISDRVIQHDYFSSLERGNYLMKPGDLILDPEQASNYDPVIQSKISPLQLSSLHHPSINIIEGISASGSEFVGTAQRKHAIHKQCQGALIVDMEASAIAVIANQYNIAFLITKTISDELHSDDSISQDFSSFLINASRNSAIIARLIISKNK